MHGYRMTVQIARVKSHTIPAEILHIHYAFDWISLGSYSLE